jgi:hypothetical protein
MGMEDAGRNKVQLELAMWIYDGMPGVVTAGKAHNHLGLFGQLVNYLALAFISPLAAYGSYNRHRCLLRV